MPIWHDLSGQRFGRLVATNESYTDEKGQRRWKCVCDCGRIVLDAPANRLKRGLKTSCGCYRFEVTLALVKHLPSHNKKGIAGVFTILPKEEHKGAKPVYVSEVKLNRDGKRKRCTLYSGTDFFEACCARKSYENKRLEIGNFI